MSLFEAGQRARHAALQPDQMGGRRVGPGAELVEVTAGAEGPALPAQLDPCDARVGRGHRERLDQLVAHLGVQRVEAAGRVRVMARVAPSRSHGHPRAPVPVRARAGARHARPRTRAPTAGPSRPLDSATRPSPTDRRCCPRSNRASVVPVMGRVARFSSIRPSAGSPSSTTTSHSSSHAIADRATGHPDDDEGEARPPLVGHMAGCGHPFRQGDHHGATAFGVDVAAQLGEECFGTEEVEDQMTLPCRRGRSPGGSVGRPAARWR